MSSTLDILYIVLAIAIALLTIFLSVTLIYVILILRDVNKVTETARETAEKMSSYVVRPIMLATQVIKRLTPAVNYFLEKKEELTEKMEERRKRRKE